MIKSVTEPSEIIDEFCEDYGHAFPVAHTVEKEHYLEVHARLKNETLRYEDVSKVVAVLSYCIADLSPELNPLTVRKMEK